MKHIFFCIITVLFIFQVNAQNKEKCESLAAKLLSENSYVEQITKDWDKKIKENGGTGYGIQFYGTEKNIYQLVLVQHYPDRDYNSNWFTIDVKNKSAYEENMADPLYNKPLIINDKDWNKLKKCNQ
ncbi:hypothetical protein [Chishuiella sp.]|uniref:hypothetical protein n=1 Tax=Chishuiella sp. TaxID=1969467 RepID=UPI0028ACAA0A|nr:hypothetical protein [Chishuiella sp.]